MFVGFADQAYRISSNLSDTFLGNFRCSNTADTLVL